MSGGGPALEGISLALIARLKAEFSNYHARGELFTHDNSLVVATTTANVGVISTGWTLGERTRQPYVGVNASAGTITIGDKGAGMYRIFCNASHSSNKIGTIHGYITIDNVKQNNVAWERGVTSINKIGYAADEGYVLLVPGNILRYVLESTATNTNITINHGGFHCEWIGGE